jgi:hypothetical protein
MAELAAIAEGPICRTTDNETYELPPPPKLAGLQAALCAMSYYQRRHVWKEKGTRRSCMAKHRRIKDLSKSGYNRMRCKDFIRQAREAGFRGSIYQQVMDPANHEEIYGKPKNNS